jgi:hypothetical protein
MSLNITDHFRQTFDDNFRLALQQTESQMRECAIVRTGLTGVAQQINEVESIEMEETTGQRFKDTTLTELGTNMRWFHPRDFQKATGESRWDPKGLAPTVMPGGKHLSLHTAAFNRKVDDVFIDGLLGVSYQGKTGSTQQGITQIVPVDFVGTGSDTDSRLTPAKIIEARRILKSVYALSKERMRAGIKLFGIIDSEEEAYLYQLANSSSSDRLFSKDYGPPVFDAEGNLTYWMGVKWISYEGLPTGTATGASTTVNIKKAAVFCSDAVELGFWEDLSVTIDRRADKSNATQYLTQAQIGSGRTDEKRVVQINILDA